MEIIKKLQKDYGYDILAFSTLLALFIILACIFVAHQGSPITDCFAQGAYIPAEILKGKILYKDIIVPYGPISYQFNAILFIVFGEHLNTLYAAGIVNSLVILSTIYLIARSISSRWVAFTVSFMVMILCVFHYYIFNYVFPYSYAMIYALSTFLLSLSFIIYYLKTSNPRYIPISFVFIGISILNKPDFFLFLFILLAITSLLKPVPVKYLLVSLIASVIIPIISWSFLFLQGLTLSDLSSYFFYMKKFIHSPDTKYFYGVSITLQNIKTYFDYYISSFRYISIICLVLTIFIYPSLLLVHNKYTRLKFPKIITIIAFYLTSPIIIIFLNKYLKNIRSGVEFCWIVLATILITLFIIGFHLIKSRNQQDKIKNLPTKDKILILIAITGIIISLRSGFFLTFQAFGTFLLPLLLMVNVIFITDYLPGYLKFLDKNVWKKTCSIILAAIAISIALKYMYIVNNNVKYPVTTKKGTIYTSQIYAKPLNDAIKYISEEMPQNASFIMIPQGPILNFLTDHSSHGWYYDLIPPTILSFGEDKIIKDLEKNPPDYIFVNNRDTVEWGFSYFGKDYGLKINHFIKQNYKLEKEVGNEFSIKIYERKDKTT